MNVYSAGQVRLLYSAEPTYAEYPDFGIHDRVLEVYPGNEKEVTVSDAVTKIGAYAFQDCTALVSVTIPEGVTEIGDSAFSDEAGLWIF